MLEVGIICGRVGEKENRQLKSAFEREDVKCHLLELQDLAISVGTGGKFMHPSVDIATVPGFIIRGLGFTSLSRSFFRFDVLYALEHYGHRVINRPLVTERTFNKAHASVIMDAAGIPTPKTIIAERIGHAIDAFDLLGGDVLVKPIYGSQGVGIFRLQEKSYAERVFLELFQIGAVFYIQEFHECAPPPTLPIKNSFDIRVFVVDGAVVGSMIREATSGGWKANVHAGATPRRVVLPDEVVDLALGASKALGLEIAGIDLMFSRQSGSWLVLEANSCPGWSGLSRVCDVDVPGKIVSYYKKTIKG
ncbi:MAG: ATP-grasp domain-containing protein [Promethearchaeota archaeon]